MKYPTLSPSPGNLVVDIPFPYSQFRDTQFILSETRLGDSLFIPDNRYRRIDENRIEILDKTMNLNSNSELRFTFIHQNNKRWVGKEEYHFTVTEEGTRTFQLPSIPYSKLIELNRRVYVFFNRIRQSPGLHYKFENTTGRLVVLSKKFRGNLGDKVDVLIIYQSSPSSKSIQELPESGYIYLNNKEIDRNYSKDRMAIFMNGKLVDREDVIRISNGTYKISRDIGSTYNLDVRSLSPKVNSLSPYYKRLEPIVDIPPQEAAYDFLCRIEQLYAIPKGRKTVGVKFNPVYFDPELVKQPDLWINLVHTGINHNNPKENRLRYRLKLYGDDYIDDPSDLYVLTQARHIGEDDMDPVSPSPVLIGLINGQIDETQEDTIIASSQVSTILKCDRYGTAQGGVNGLIGRFQSNPRLFRDPTPLYYTFSANKFEVGHEVCLFEWTISSERNNRGVIYWRKHIWMIPENREEILAQKGDIIDDWEPA
jgi:hypothetical protein